MERETIAAEIAETGHKRFTLNGHVWASHFTKAGAVYWTVLGHGKTTRRTLPAEAVAWLLDHASDAQLRSIKRSAKLDAAWHAGVNRLSE